MNSLWPLISALSPLFLWTFCFLSVSVCVSVSVSVGVCVCGSHTDDDHSFSQLSVHEALTYPEGAIKLGCAAWYDDKFFHKLLHLRNGIASRYRHRQTKTDKDGHRQKTTCLIT